MPRLRPNAKFHSEGSVETRNSKLNLSHFGDNSIKISENIARAGNMVTTKREIDIFLPASQIFLFRHLVPPEKSNPQVKYSRGISKSESFEVIHIPPKIPVFTPETCSLLTRELRKTFNSELGADICPFGLGILRSRKINSVRISHVLNIPNEHRDRKVLTAKPGRLRRERITETKFKSILHRVKSIFPCYGRN